MNNFYIALVVVFFFVLVYFFLKKSSKENPFNINGSLLWIDRGRSTKPFYNNAFAVFGKPDYLYKTNTGVTAVEFKSRYGAIFESDIVQSKAAALAARGSGYKVDTVVVKTSTQMKSISLPHSDKELFDQISQFVAIAQNAKAGISIPGSPSYGKCKGCAYRGRCKYVSR